MNKIDQLQEESHVEFNRALHRKFYISYTSTGYIVYAVDGDIEALFESYYPDAQRISLKDAIKYGIDEQGLYWDNAILGDLSRVGAIAKSAHLLRQELRKKRFIEILDEII